jgi:hypothetical protein
LHSVLVKRKADKAVKVLGGRGSVDKLNPSYAGSGRLPAWYHAHWKPEDTKKYPGDVVKCYQLRKSLQEDSASMVCCHCQATFRYNPSTTFKNHLLSACASFQATSAWNDIDVQRDVAKLQNKKVCKGCKGYIALTFICHDRVLHSIR